MKRGSNEDAKVLLPPFLLLEFYQPEGERRGAGAKCSIFNSNDFQSPKLISKWKYIPNLPENYT